MRLAADGVLHALDRRARAWAWRRSRLCARFGVAPRSGGRMLMGFFGLVLLIGAEIAMTRAMRGLSPQEWLAHFASVEGVIYAALLAAFAAMPWVRR